MTVMASSGSFSTVQDTEAGVGETHISAQQLNDFVAAGVITRIDKHSEHYAIQPCWMYEPAKGVLEEINSSVLGKWNKKLRSYVVYVDNLRNNERSAGMNEDHRWLHVDVFATFYTYTPIEGQQLKGEIKKVGGTAAICVVFDVFTATVFPNNESEIHSWNVGDELEFTITSFVHRRKGPILKARSLCLSNTTEKYNQAMDELEFESTNCHVPQEEELQTGITKSKKSKRKSTKKDMEEILETNDPLCHSSNSSPTEKKGRHSKKKKKLDT